MLLAPPRVEPRVAQSTAVLRECKCENNIVSGPSRSDVNLLIGLNRVGLCEHGNEHFGCRAKVSRQDKRHYVCKYGATLQRHV